MDALNIDAAMQAMGRQARAAGHAMATATPAARNAALHGIAQALDGHRAELLAANARDLEAGAANDLAAPLMDRLHLDDAAIDRMIDGVRQVAALADPVGAITELRYQPSGIQVGRMRVPLGVVGIIYESRPNVTVDAAALCLKAGNACILRGGSEAIHSNKAVAACISMGLAAGGLPEHAVQLVATTDRAAVAVLITMDQYVDVLVPRGGKGLIERISRDARVPVIKHLDGNCHLYVDEQADADMAVALVENAKTQRYGVCNSLETLLVHAAVAEQVLPMVAAALAPHGVELRGCPATCAVLGELAHAASEDDWYEEYLAPVLAVRVVPDMAAAIDHIHHYGSAHTDAICTRDHATAWRFAAAVDSANVVINASTRFSDGYEYGLGAEIGISTNKLHARGPVGLEGLTTYKWLVLGDGHLRS